MYNPRQNNEKRKKRKLPLWSKISLWVVGSLIFLVVSLAVLALIFEEKIADQIVKYTYTQFDTKISHKSLKFSLIKNFPRGTATLRDVVILEKTDSLKKENLLVAEKIDLQFNFWSIFANTISIERIDIKKATVNIKYFEDGKNNFDIFHPKPQEPGGSDFSLKNVTFKDVQINYTDFASQQEYSLLIKNGKASGDFKKEQFLMKLKGDFHVQAIRIGEINYFKEKDVNLNVEFQVTHASNEFLIKKGDLKLGNLVFEVTGRIVKKDYHISILGNDLEIKKLIDAAPDIYKEWFTPYKPIGFANIKLEILRDESTEKKTRITGEASIKNATITRISSGVALTGLNTLLTFTNGKKVSLENCKLDIPQISFRIGDSRFSGNFSIENFQRPIFSTLIDADFDLAMIKKFFLDDKMEYLTGSAKTNLALTFQAKSMKIDPQDLLKAKSFGILEVKDLTAKSKSNNLQFSKGNGFFEYRDNGLNVKKLTGVVNNSDFNIQGHFQNVLNWLFFEDQPIDINVSVHSNYCNLGNIIEGFSAQPSEQAATQTATKSSAAQTVYKINPKFNYTLRLSASNFVFNKFSATDANIDMSMKNQRILLRSMRFNSCDGLITASAEVDGSTHRDKFIVSCNASVKNADVVKLMKSFNNFGQQEITTDNVEGKISLNTWFSLLFSNTLQPDKSSLKATAEVTLDNGRLRNYKTLESLASFMDVKKLKDITFKRISNEFSILNSVVTIPEMKIENSVCDFVVSGKHDFSGKLDYHISLLISDYVKARFGNDKPPASAEFGVIQDDGLNQGRIWIAVSGTTDKPQFKWDKTKAKEKRKNDMKNVSEDIKSLIRGDLKESGKITPPQNPREIIFDDGELEKTDKPQQQPAKKPVQTQNPVTNPNEIIFDDN